MTFTEAEQLLLSLTNFPRQEFMTDPKRNSAYMKRLQFFLNILGNPEKKIPHYIHVTGTSGKGSVCMMLESILRASGKKTGLNMSPHIGVITERWQVNGRAISKKRFVELVQELKPFFDIYLNTSPYEMISYFELMTAIAFYEFAKQKVEWAVMEVGLGGLYDPANLMPHKDVAVITNIGTDHADLMGTKAQIAKEKSGIIRHRCHVFTGERDKKMLSIIQKETTKECCQLSVVSSKSCTVTEQSLDGLAFSYDNERYSLPVLGKHQTENAMLSIDIAKHLALPDHAITKGLSSIRLPHRMEIISKNPLIIIDGAHNPEKMKTTIETTNQILKSKIYNLHLVVAFSHDKPWKRMIKQLASLQPKSVICTRQTINPFRKVADPKDIAKEFRRLCPNAHITQCFDPSDAKYLVQKNCKKHDLTLITGSMFLNV